MVLADKNISNGYSEPFQERNRLVRDYLPCVKRIVKRLAIHLPATVDTEELINAGIIGLIQAADNYDPSRDNKFITYASFRIKGAVLSELRSRDFLSRSHRKQFREMEKVKVRLEQAMFRPPEDEEVAAELGIDMEQFRLIQAQASISFVSLEEMGVSGPSEKQNVLGQIFGDSGADAFSLTRLKEIQNALAEAIDELPDRQRLVVSLYYYEELTMKEVGKVLDITESRVSQIHSQALKRLRTKLKKAQVFEDDT